jgi:hypothetical protein
MIGQDLIGKKVVVRTYSAGVHVGTLSEREGKEALLVDTRRIWRWRGANTINEIATRGIDAATSGYTRVSESSHQNLLTEAIEIVPMTPQAWESVCSAGWAK